MHQPKPADTKRVELAALDRFERLLIGYP